MLHPCCTFGNNCTLMKGTAKPTHILVNYHTSASPTPSQPAADKVLSIPILIGTTNVERSTTSNYNKRKR